MLGYKTSEVKQNEFQFLCKEYATKDADWGRIWDDFLSNGAYDVIAPFRTPMANGECPSMNIFFKKNPGEVVAYIGQSVKDVDLIPSGYKLITLPTEVFLAIDYDGNNQNLVKPEEFVPNIDSNYVRIEFMYYSDEWEGPRWEVWHPIKKQ
jgi:predicted transcriptional regulator YdeE